MDESEFINVAIRIRPGDAREENPCLQIISKHPPVSVKTFTIFLIYTTFTDIVNA